MSGPKKDVLLGSWSSRANRQFACRNREGDRPRQDAALH